MLTRPPGPTASAPRSGRLAAAARAIRGLKGLARTGTAFAAGAFGALAMPPVSFWPALALSFPVLVLLLDGCAGIGAPADASPPRGPRQRLRALRQRLGPAAATGWGFGFGYFLASLWWIGAAFLVDAEAFGLLMPFAVLAMPAGLAVFTALGAMLAALVWSATPLRLFGFAAGLTVAEWLRGHVLTGFPWNSFGYAFADTLVLMQSAALVGLWGLAFFALLLRASPVLLLEGRRGRLGCAAAALVLAGAAAWGWARLEANPTRFVDGVNLRLMQPNLPQDRKFAYDHGREILADYLALSTRPSATHPQGLEGVTVLIWPESAFPFIYEREPWAQEAIAAALPPNVTLVTGAVRYGAPPDGQMSPFFNAIRVIAADGAVRMSTDKVHLVPFGEYLPFQNTLESIGIEQLTRVRGGFSSAPGLRMLSVPGLPPVAPLVCYEAVFPHAVLPPSASGERPGLLLNLTNDAWFGRTPGPYQHFVQARLRAVEEGLPMVRVANTGISAVIDPLGRTLARTRLGEEAILDFRLPVVAQTPPMVATSAHTVLVTLLIIAFGLALTPLYPMFTR